VVVLAANIKHSIDNAHGAQSSGDWREDSRSHSRPEIDVKTRVHTVVRRLTWRLGFTHSSGDWRDDSGSHIRPEIDVKTRVHTVVRRLTWRLGFTQIEEKEAFNIIESINKEGFLDFVGIIKDTSKVVDSVVTGEFVEEDLKTLDYMTKTLNQIIFFSSTKIRIFFSATLGIRIFF
jgi:hypothetical protein